MEQKRRNFGKGYQESSEDKLPPTSGSSRFANPSISEWTSMLLIPYRKSRQDLCEMNSS